MAKEESADETTLPNWGYQYVGTIERLNLMQNKSWERIEVKPHSFKVEGFDIGAF